MADEGRVPPGIDIGIPSIARVYDAFLDGKDNFPADREVVEAFLQVVPDAKRHAKENREFLQRAVSYLVAETSIRQFLDLGSGLPTQRNVHEVAQGVDSRARVVYVDNDPIVLVHARALLGGTDTTRVITADLRRPVEILNNPTVQEFLDFDQPVGLLMFAILHHINDEEDPAGIAACLRDALPSGSYMAISHFHNPGEAHPEFARRAAEAEKIFTESLGTGRFRTREEILGYFGDLELIEPGLVWLPEWRLDPGCTYTPNRAHHLSIGGVARKR